VREPGHRCSTPAVGDTLCRSLPPAVPQRTIPVYGCAAATAGGCRAAHRCCRPSRVVAARGGGLPHHRLCDPPTADHRCRRGDCPLRDPRPVPRLTADQVARLTRRDNANAAGRPDVLVLRCGLDGPVTGGGYSCAPAHRAAARPCVAKRFDDQRAACRRLWRDAWRRASEPGSPEALSAGRRTHRRSTQVPAASSAVSAVLLFEPQRPAQGRFSRLTDG